MYFLHIYFDQARMNGSGEIGVVRNGHSLAKWTLLTSGPSSRELLQLIALACGGTSLFSHLPFSIKRLCRHSGIPLQVECVLASHPPYEAPMTTEAFWGGGVRLELFGVLRSLKKTELRFIPPDLPAHRAKTGLGNSWLFLLGYGADIKCHVGTDDFDFNDPFFRLSRFHSLFSNKARVTDPVEFLNRIHNRAVKYKRLAPTQALERLSLLSKTYLAIDTSGWMEKECDFRLQWSYMSSWQQQAMLPILDAVRHLLGAFPTCAKPLDLPGLILFDRPDRVCNLRYFSRWIEFLDELFPEMQFLMTVGDQARVLFPGRLLTKHCQIQKRPEPKEKKPARIPKGTILLLDVDSRLPNLALMKLSRYFKEQGKRVVLERHNAFRKGVEAVYASAVFYRPLSQARLKKLRKHYGEALLAGGSGVDVHKRLPAEVEKLPADYSLYPEFGDCAIGFLTRGCPFHCPFCIVPAKEGKIRQVARLDELLQKGRRKLILLDDNILAHPEAGELLEEMASRRLKVNFTQTLDLRLLDQEKARLLKRVDCSNLRFTRRVYHFSLNDNRNLIEMGQKYHQLQFTGKDNVEFICMYGFNTTLAEDLERFRFLRSLPGAYVFMQKYQPVPGGPPPQEAEFFDERADDRIDELTRIVFAQNMKSMEKYYRWVSRQYAQTFGRLHQGLVDTIFKYNYRQERGRYLTTLAPS